MKRLFSLTAIAVALLVLAASPAISAQQQAPAQIDKADKVFEGELSKVDSAAKTLSVKGTGGAEMVFAYSDQTQVTGPDKTVQGLAGKAGATLKITYRDLDGRHMATRIETVEAK